MEEYDNTKKTYPEGHFIGMWIGLGIAIFTAIWIPMVIALDKIALIGVGPGIGVALGLAIGAGAEKKAKKEGRMRPRENKDNQRSNIVLLAGLALLLLGVLLALFIWMKRG
jgi:hypothetical protein